MYRRYLRNSELAQEADEAFREPRIKMGFSQTSAALCALLAWLIYAHVSIPSWYQVTTSVQGVQRLLKLPQVSAGALKISRERLASLYLPPTICHGRFSLIFVSGARPSGRFSVLQSAAWPHLNRLAHAAVAPVGVPYTASCHAPAACNCREIECNPCKCRA